MSAATRSPAPAGGTDRIRYRPVDEFTVEWCLPALWERYDAAEAGSGAGPHPDPADADQSRHTRPLEMATPSAV